MNDAEIKAMLLTQYKLKPFDIEDINLAIKNIKEELEHGDVVHTIEAKEIELKFDALKQKIEMLELNPTYQQAKPFEKVLNKIDQLEIILEAADGVTNNSNLFSPNLAVLYSIKEKIISTMTVTKKQLEELNQLYTRYK